MMSEAYGSFSILSLNFTKASIWAGMVEAG